MRSSVLLVIVILIIAALLLFVYGQYEHGIKEVPSSHVYLGAIYSGNTEYCKQVSASVSFSPGRNLQGNIYYVVLSVWDSNRSYDQLGISSLNGSFFSTYSYTYIGKRNHKLRLQPRMVLHSTRESSPVHGNCCGERNFHCG